MIIPGYDIRDLVLSREVDLNTQIQPAGIDLTVKQIGEYLGPGVLDFSNEERIIPKIRWRPWGMYDRSDTIYNDYQMRLPSGVYIVEANPVVEIPMDMIAFAQPRSSLTRMGCGIHSGIWDPGYKGDSVFVLNVYNPHGMIISKDARIAQLVYARMESPATEGYDGVYQGQGIADIETESAPAYMPKGMDCVPGIADMTKV